MACVHIAFKLREREALRLSAVCDASNGEAYDAEGYNGDGIVHRSRLCISTGGTRREYTRKESEGKNYIA